MSTRARPAARPPGTTSGRPIFRDSLWPGWLRIRLKNISRGQDRADAISRLNNKEKNKMNTIIREIRAEDTQIAGKYIYEAFYGISTQHNFTPDFPSVEAATGFAKM